MEEAIRSRKPTLINAVIDEKAGTESGRITSLNPTAESDGGRKRGHVLIRIAENHNEQGTRRRSHPRFHACAIGTNLHVPAWLGADVVKT
jgi:hypothetical protein